MLDDLRVAADAAQSRERHAAERERVADMRVRQAQDVEDRAGLVTDKADRAAKAVAERESAVADREREVERREAFWRQVNTAPTGEREAMTDHQILSAPTSSRPGKIETRSIPAHNVYIRASDGAVLIGDATRELHTPDAAEKECALQLPLVRQVGTFKV